MKPAFTFREPRQSQDVQKKEARPVSKQESPISTSDKYTTALLFVINLANFADRMTVPSVLVKIGKSFGVENQTVLGLIQTVFVITFMAFGPIFGYLGDRFSRRLLMAVGLFAWASFSLASAFVDPQMENSFWLFLTLRALVGIGEASYATISPTIISDLYVGRRRTVAIFIYQFVMLLGSGIGYMMASAVTAATGSWQYAFMVWPPLVYLCIIGLFFMKEPERGKAEGTSNIKATTYREDLSYLVKIKSYVLSTIGGTSQSFVVGALSFWAPTFAEYQMQMSDPDANVAFVGFIFGFLTIMGGLSGAAIGTISSRGMYNIKSIGQSADAMTCAVGSLITGPLIYATLMISRYTTVGMWVMIYLALSCLSINIVVNQKILLYILIPTRRATGGGLQLLVNHLLGDASSPYIIGAIIDAFKYAAVNDTVPPRESNSLEDFIFRQNALLVLSCVCTVAAFCYFFCSLFVHEDKDNARTLAASLSSKSLAALATIPLDPINTSYPETAASNKSFVTETDDCNSSPQLSNMAVL